MKLLTKAPRGTQDTLPQITHRWQIIERVATETARVSGFREIRIPTFEHTELFHRSVGDTTDIVQKEMFTFEDRGGRSLSLRPEGTAGVVRAMLENGLLNETLPAKVSYLISCFRNERPQAGRFKEFHQFGIEMFGAALPEADIEVIAVANKIFNVIGIRGLELQLNSIGCPECRKKYQDALKEYFRKSLDDMCDACKDRFEKNPMRILDCKTCENVTKDAPIILDYICEECSNHFDQVKQGLTDIGIEYVVNPSIVRGLDYYTRTVFEFVSTDLGAQSTVCGGGRYDSLIEIMGGRPTPGLGFAIGLERLMMIINAQNVELPESPSCELYIATLGDKARSKAVKLVYQLRNDGFFVETDTVGRGLKAQMRYADKIGAKLSCVLGDNEISEGKATIKDMRSGDTVETNFDSFKDVLYETQLKELNEKIGGF